MSSHPVATAIAAYNNYLLAVFSRRAWFTRLLTLLEAVELTSPPPSRSLSLSCLQVNDDMAEGMEIDESLYSRQL